MGEKLFVLLFTLDAGEDAEDGGEDGGGEDTRRHGDGGLTALPLGRLGDGICGSLGDGGGGFCGISVGRRFGGGVGLGFGLDFWKLQLSCSYKWDLGNVVQFEGQSAGDIAGEAISAMKEESKMSGVEVSLALFF